MKQASSFEYYHSPEDDLLLLDAIKHGCRQTGEIKITSPIPGYYKVVRISGQVIKKSPAVLS